MNINDFTNSIDKKIIDRGYSYYIEGNINDLYKSNHDEYIVHIVGSSSYKVRVQMLDNGDIVRSTCDCPYDFGPTCKHEVAAYFLLAERWREENIPVRMEAMIQTILSNLSKEELIEIIIKITDDDPTFEQNILFKYTSKDDDQTLESSKKLINAIVKKYQGREGFISYYDAADFANELEKIADNTRKMKNPIVALDIAFILLEEAIDAISYSDDSSGGIGFLIKQIIESIHEIVSNKPKDISEELFWKLLEQVDNEVLDCWTDYKIDLLTICIDLVEEEEHVVLLTFKIKSMITENSRVKKRRNNLFMII